MFDVGFWELALIGVIALIIIGPERLPAAAHTVGQWVGKGRRMLRDVKADIDRELREQNVADIAALQKAAQSAGDQFKQATEKISESVDVTDVEQAAASLKASFEEASPLTGSSSKAAGKTGAAKKIPRGQKDREKGDRKKTAAKKSTAKKKVVKKKTAQKKTAQKKTAQKKTAQKKTSGLHTAPEPTRPE